MGGQKISRKLAAFGQTLEVEQAQRRMDMEEANQLQVANALQKSSKHFVSYNDLEGTLMFCAIVVALSGTMFGTTYFDNPFRLARCLLGISEHLHYCCIYWI